MYIDIHTSSTNLHPYIHAEIFMHSITSIIACSKPLLVDDMIWGYKEPIQRRKSQPMNWEILFTGQYTQKTDGL